MLISPFYFLYARKNIWLQKPSSAIQFHNIFETHAGIIDVFLTDHRITDNLKTVSYKYLPSLYLFIMHSTVTRCFVLPLYCNQSYYYKWFTITFPYKDTSFLKTEVVVCVLVSIHTQIYRTSHHHHPKVHTKHY